MTVPNTAYTRQEYLGAVGDSMCVYLGCKLQWSETSTTKCGWEGYRVRKAVQKEE